MTIFFWKKFTHMEKFSMPRKKELDEELLSSFMPAERKQVVSTVMVDGHQVARSTIKQDPLQLKLRLYTQIGELLHQLEGATDEPITVRERIAALVAIGRLQDLLIEKGKDEDANAGSAIRKYSSAFKNGSSGRKKNIGAPAKLSDSDSSWGDELGDDDRD